MRRLLLAAALCCPGLAVAGELEARDTAQVGPQGSWSVGVFAPLTYALSDRVELQGHPLVFLGAPNLLARVEHYSHQNWQVTGEYGLSVPTLLLRLTRGFLFAEEEPIGLYLVPRAGVVASRSSGEGGVLTASADLAFGLRLTEGAPGPRQAFAPLEMLLAPVTHRWRAKAGARYDHPLHRRWRVRGELDLFAHGRGPSAFTLRGGAGVDLGIGQRSRLTLGGWWWNLDEGARNPESGARRRTNELWPALDFIWAG